MFETLDIMISLGVVFLILSMILKYLLSFTKRIFNTKAKVVAEEMKTFVGENTSKYLIPYLEQKAKHLNFLDNTKRKGTLIESKGLRQLNKEQVIDLVNSLKEYIKDKADDDVQGDLNLKDLLGSEEIKKIKAVKDIEDHLKDLRNRVEKNYDNTMQKISTIYETKLRNQTLIWGMILALLFNADIFEMYRMISSNAQIGDRLAAQAEVIGSQMKLMSAQIEEAEKKETESFKKLTDEAEKMMASFNENLTGVGLRFGWRWENFTTVKYDENPKRYILYWFKKFLGIFISGFLISFGAPFWHDLLGSFTGIRNILRGKTK